MPARKPTGFVIYQGPSQLDGAPIVAIVTTRSRNSKTGAMLQTHIIRADVDPITANREGLDYSICGHCPHRGRAYIGKTKGLAPGRSCYVNLGQAPRTIYRTFKRGRYPVVIGHAAIAALGRGRMVRIGAYGDGAAVPDWIWDSLVSEAKGHTAYSHQRHIRSGTFNARRYMVSADSLESATDAWRSGARTFRIVRDPSELVAGREILCPASAEAGRRTTCGKCGLCGGSAVAARSIAIVAHGAGARNI